MQRVMLLTVLIAVVCGIGIIGTPQAFAALTNGELVNKNKEALQKKKYKATTAGEVKLASEGLAVTCKKGGKASGEILSKVNGTISLTLEGCQSEGKACENAGKEVIEVKGAELLVTRTKQVEIAGDHVDIVPPTKGTEHSFEFKCGETGVLVWVGGVESASSTAVTLAKLSTKKSVEYTQEKPGIQGFHELREVLFEKPKEYGGAWRVTRKFKEEGEVLVATLEMTFEEEAEFL